jgi:hypothetical protein
MRLQMGSMSLTTLAVEACCRTAGYTGAAVLVIDDHFTRRKPKRTNIGASITINGKRRRRANRTPPRAASRAS